MLNFFERTSKLERIVNVNGLALGAIKAANGRSSGKYDYAPSESVVASCTASTFYSHDSATPAPASKPAAK
jgi:hypothetical protein